MEREKIKWKDLSLAQQQIEIKRRNDIDDLYEKTMNWLYDK